jgi:hypothetical protein
MGPRPVHLWRILVFGIIGHYCGGARWPTGELFMRNISLWWACPWTLSVAAVQAGGLGMVALGLAHLTAARMVSGQPGDAPKSTAWWLCIASLVGVFFVGYPGYFAFDAVWPSFYYSPVATGKNAWLLSQGFFIAVYLVGALTMFNITRRFLDLVPATA